MRGILYAVATFATGACLFAPLLLLMACGATNGGDSPPVAADHRRVPPSGVTAYADGGRIFVTWTPVDGARSYLLYWGSAPGFPPATERAVACAAPPCEHVGMASGLTYYYVMTALYDDGESAPSEETVLYAADCHRTPNPTPSIKEN